MVYHRINAFGLPTTAADTQVVENWKRELKTRLEIDVVNTWKHLKNLQTQRLRKIELKILLAETKMLAATIATDKVIAV